MVYHLQEIESDKFESRLPVWGYVFDVQGKRICFPKKDEFFKLKDYAELPDVFGELWDSIEGKIEQQDSVTFLIRNRRGEFLSTASTLTQPIWTLNPPQYQKTVYSSYVPKMPYGVDADGERLNWLSAEDEIPSVKNIYEYRNDELLTKLYQVKLWIERYITGVGCYISDVNGESIVLERVKSQAWMTDAHVNDMTQAGRFTPRAQLKTVEITDASGNTKTVDSSFVDSSICVTCSLNEFRSLTIDDYADFPIERFIRWEYDASGNIGPMIIDASVSGEVSEMSIYPSPTLDSLTVADEYVYTLLLDNTPRGSLYEFADASCKDNPIMVSDGEIMMFDETKHTSSITNSTADSSASNECPVIEIIKGNIREVYGDWAPDSDDNNIAWSVVTQLGDDGNYYVKLTSQSDEYLYETTDEDMLSRYKKADSTHIYPTFISKGALMLTPEKHNACFEYTDRNRWGLPMIVVRGYYPSNQMPGDYAKHRDFRAASPDFFPRNRQFIIEILEGSIRFRNR